MPRSLRRLLPRLSMLTVLVHANLESECPLAAWDNRSFNNRYRPFADPPPIRWKHVPVATRCNGSGKRVIVLLVDAIARPLLEERSCKLQYHGSDFRTKSGVVPSCHSETL